MGHFLGFAAKKIRKMPMIEICRKLSATQYTVGYLGKIEIPFMDENNIEDLPVVLGVFEEGVEERELPRH